MELDSRNIEEFTHQIPPDFLIKQTPLSRISEEFGIIEYQLQLALRSPSCEVENIWIISNPHVTMQFEKRTHVCRNTCVFLYYICYYLLYLFLKYFQKNSRYMNITSPQPF